MEAIIRKPFQGVRNIVCFNRHFYLLTGFFLLSLFLLKYFLPAQFNAVITAVISLGIIAVLVSLIVAYYVYDYSDLYKLHWLDDLSLEQKNTMVNVHAGYDELSISLQNKFSLSQLIVFDFYHPHKHTELSIARARKAIP